MTRVRPASDEDRSAIVDVHVAAVRARGQAAYEDEQVAAWADWADRGGPELDDGQHWVVAERDGTVAGYGRVDPDEPEAEVTATYVHPDHDRAGVGSTLLASLEGYTRASGAEECSLWASRNAVPFYERAGYERVGEAAHEMADGVALTIVEMRKPLW